MRSASDCARAAAGRFSADVGGTKLEALRVAVHEEYVRAAGDVVIVRGDHAHEVEHHRDRRLRHGGGGGVVDVSDEEALDAVLQPGDRAARPLKTGS